MFLIPAHYFNPSSSSLSHFLVSPGYASHVFTNVTLCFVLFFFPSPDVALPPFLQQRILLSRMLCEPSNHGHWPWCSLSSRTQMAMPRALSSNISKAMLVPTAPVAACLCRGTWKAGCLCCPQSLEDSSAWAQLSIGGQAMLPPSSEHNLPSCSPSVGIVQCKGSQPCLTLEFPADMDKYQCFTCALKFWINMHRSLWVWI